MQDKQTSTELYEYLVQGILQNKEKKLKEKYKEVCKFLETKYTDVKVLTVNAKRPKGVEKLIVELIKEIKKNTITYMEAVKTSKYIWIAYRIKKN